MYEEDNLLLFAKWDSGIDYRRLGSPFIQENLNVPHAWYSSS